MARRIAELHFDPAKPVIVRRPFVGSGRHYAPGDPFPWRQLSVSQGRVKLLFDAGKLRHQDEGVSKPSSPEPAQEPAGLSPPSAPATPESDDLDDLSMPELREIAQSIGAKFQVSKRDQREAIREKRREG